MNTPFLSTSIAALLTLSLVAKAQVVTTGGLTLSGSRGSLDGATDLSFAATAFADGLIANGGYAPTHLVPNVNNGTYGNASSWIGGSYIGLSWGHEGQTIQSIAFGRDNTGVYQDRTDGTYTLQYTTADLSTLSIPGSGSTAGVVGAAADGLGWVTVGTINLTGRPYRSRFDLGFSLSGVTGIRLIAPGGAAVDEFEVYTSRASAAAMSPNLTISSAAGYTVGWDGNDGAYFSAASPATVPNNLALGATAVTSSDLGPQLAIPFHRSINLNDGLYGNNRSWISGTADTVNPFGGVTFVGGARHVSGVAWGRDNGNNVSDGPNQQFTDRALGTYTLQSLDPADNTTWLTLGIFAYTGDDDATVGGGFTSWLRHQYSLATAGGAIRSAGIRLMVPPGGFGSNAIDELEVYGTTMTWTNGAASGKWNLNTDANFSGAADGRFLAQDGVRFGNAGAGTITLEGSLTPGAVTVDAVSNYVFTGPGAITGPATLTKSGAGRLTLTGAHTYSGTTTVEGGTLKLDFSGAGAPAANILNNTANSSALVLAGSTLSLVGKASTLNTQQFNGVTLRAGAAAIQLTADPVANPLSLNLGAITRNVGGTLDIKLPAGTASATNGVVTSSGTAGTILTDSGVAFATIGGGDWAAQAADGTHLVALSSIVGGYTNSDASSLTGNADVASGVDTTLAAGTSITSLRFNQNESRSVTIAEGQTLTTGGILVTGTVAAAGSSITGGTLAGAAGKDLVILQNSSQPFLIGSVIADNTSATGLTKAGNGTLTLSGLNTFTGNVLVAVGTLETATTFDPNASALGANTVGKTVTIAQGATLVTNGFDSIDFGAFTVNQLAFRIRGTWENNPADTAGIGVQRTDNLTLQGATINDRGQHGGGYGGILMNGLVTVSGAAPSAYNQLGGGSGLGVLATTFDVQNVTGDPVADFTVNGTIRDTPAGAGSLQKRGTGTMVLTGLNAYTGTTTVTGGTLSLQGGAIGVLSNVWIGNGATLSADVLAGNNRHDLAGNLVLAGGTLAGNANVSDTNTGQFFLSDAGQQVVVHGDATSTLAAELHVSGTHIFNVEDGASAVDLLVTGQLSHYHTVAWGGIRKTGGGTMFLASSMDGTNSAGVSGIYGLGGFELAGGTLLFSGSLGYSAFDPANKAGYFLADFSGNSTLKWAAGNTSDVSVNGNLRIRDGVTATLDTNGNNVTLATAIINGVTGTGALTKAGNGTLTLAGPNTYTGGTTISSGTLQIGNGGPIGSIGGDVMNNGTLTFKRSDDYTFGGVISGSGGLVQDGFIVRLTAAQTYTGPTQVSSGAYLALPTTVDQGLSPATVVTIAAGGNFDIANRTQTIAGLAGGGALYSYIGSSGRLTLNVATGQTYNFSGALGGGFPDFTVTKSGLGTQILSGNSTYTGATTVNGGTLSLQSTTTDTLFSVTIANGARLSADVASGVNQKNLAGNLTLTGGTLAGNANISDPAAGQFLLSNAGQQVIVSGDNQSTISAELHVAGTHIFQVDDGASAVDLLVTGKLSHFHTQQWGGLVKTGSGTMHLASSMDGTDSAGANGIYGLGGFELAGGTLLFSGSLGYSAFDPANKAGYFLADFSGNSTLKWAAGNTSDVSVNSNLRIRDGVTASLDTNGNNVTLSTAIVTGPSETGGLTKTGAGTLTLAGAQPYATLTTAGGRTDLTAALGTGTSTINANANLNISVSQTLAALNIADGVEVTFGALPPPAPFADGGKFASATPAVPEPGSGALLLGGLLTLAGRRRRRASQFA